MMQTNDTRFTFASALQIVWYWLAFGLGWVAFLWEGGCA